MPSINSGAISKVPYAEPTWLVEGYHSPYYTEARAHMGPPSVSQSHDAPQSSRRATSGSRKLFASSSMTWCILTPRCVSRIRSQTRGPCPCLTCSSLRLVKRTESVRRKASLTRWREYQAYPLVMPGAHNHVRWLRGQRGEPARDAYGPG